MVAYFLDSSALVKVYVSEPGSTWVRELLDSENLGDVYIAAIPPVEVIAALSLRTRGASQIADSIRDGIHRFRRALEDNVYIAIDLTPEVLDDATRQAETYYLRGYDAVQLAAALAVRRMQSEEEQDAEENRDSLVVVSADDELNAAAQHAGLSVENPLDYA